VSLPPTFSEAQAMVQAREEERRKAAARKDKHKQRSSKTKDIFRDPPPYPGAIPGAETNNTALWLATEVRSQEFCNVFNLLGVRKSQNDQSIPSLWDSSAFCLATEVCSPKIWKIDHPLGVKHRKTTGNCHLFGERQETATRRSLAGNRDLSS